VKCKISGSQGPLHEAPFLLEAKSVICANQCRRLATPSYFLYQKPAPIIRVDPRVSAGERGVGQKLCREFNHSSTAQRRNFRLQLGRSFSIFRISFLQPTQPHKSAKPHKFLNSLHLLVRLGPLGSVVVYNTVPLQV
jgi:hypothetical protein